MSLSKLNSALRGISCSSLDVTGDVTHGGDLDVSGNINATGNISTLTGQISSAGLTTGGIAINAGFGGGAGQLNFNDGNQTYGCDVSGSSKIYTMTAKNVTAPGTSFPVHQVVPIGSQPFVAYDHLIRTGSGSAAFTAQPIVQLLADGGVVCQPETLAAGITVPGADPDGHGRLGVSNFPSSANAFANYQMISAGSNSDGLNRSQGYLYGYYDAGSSYTEKAQTFLQFVPSAVEPEGTTNINLGLPFDPNRKSYFTGTGSSQDVVCPSITANSEVLFSISGTTDPGGFATYTTAVPRPVLGTITPGLKFAVTAQPNIIYDFLVFG